ncbi:serine/threonine-protein kinase [Streptomyces glaucescens]|uniref:serine/threonine-protein kinase n=1 Tax=Streptomyces glaucescens TaxID=1907 RepID=UPI00344D7B25
MSEGEPGRRVIDGRFALEARLGGGGMGTVWRARDLVLDRAVALKEVRSPDPGLAEYDPGAAALLRARVLREARALARVEHPNVVTIHHVVDGTEYAYPWLVMELVTGGSLADRLAGGAMEPHEAASLGREMLGALRAAHAAGIQHRDVKPANVLLRPDGRPVLTDFGIAAIRESTVLTATGSIIGTPDYMAPERVSGGEGGPESDLWSLAMMLYVAVEGRHPLRRATTLATLAAVLHEELPPPRRAGALAPMLAAALVKDPARRPDGAVLDAMLTEAAKAPARGRQPGTAHTATTSYHLAPPHASGPADAPAPMAGAAAADVGSGPPADAVPPSGRLPHGAPTVVPSFGRDREDRVRRRSRVLAVGASLASTALVGVLVWTLSDGGAGDADEGGGTPGAVASDSRASSAAPSPAADAPAGSGSGEDGPSGESGTRPDLLTPDGIRTALAALRAETGTDRMCRLVVYPEYVAADVMADGSSTRYASWSYRPGEGATKGIITGSVSSTQSPFSAGAFDWDAVPALFERAEKELNVKDITSRYLVVSGADPAFGDPMGMSAYLSNDYGQSGYLAADHRGRVTRVMPNDKEY